MDVGLLACIADSTKDTDDLFIFLEHTCSTGSLVCVKENFKPRFADFVLMVKTK